MKPGEHRYLGCGVELEPYFETETYETVSDLERTLDHYEQIGKEEQISTLDVTYLVLAAIRRYGQFLKQCPHNASQSPKNIARDLTYLIRYGTTRPEGLHHYGE